MFNKKYFLVLISIITFISASHAQICDIKISGVINDETTGLPLSNVTIVLQEGSKYAQSDKHGKFTIEGVCAGDYHLICSHIGCEIEKLHISTNGDTNLRISLSHTSTSLGTVSIQGKKKRSNHSPNKVLSRQTIEDNLNQSLSGLLENTSGVHLIKNGNNISKPVVHGMYGNRLGIVNNGILQSGQQWGNDHSPEIDPFTSDRITVLKGANALEYSGGNLGVMILVEPKHIKKEPHLHGQLNYAYETNGRGHNLNTRFEKYSPKLAWRITGTLKKYGDKSSSEYYLNNTGLKEANLSLQLEKSWNENLYIDLYASTFNTELGVLRGSHIGNLTDLEQAMQRDVPFFTDDTFSYSIDAPKQRVSHHLIKLKGKYYFTKTQSLELVLAGQINDRKEFDIRRGGRTNTPALSLSQETFNIETKYTKDFKDNWRLKLGQQSILINNTNNPGTGIFPLIPDYFTTKAGVFSTLSRKSKNLYLQFGLRYDFENQDVVTISRTIPRLSLRYKNQFHNLTGLFATNVRLTKSQSFGWNIGYTMRNPAINELYSNGLHQGVSGIEIGDENLESEKSIKNTIEYHWIPSPTFSFDGLAYHQYFKNYIFLNPQERYQLTIRGAFPLFMYEQTNAHIYGFDLNSQFTISRNLFGKMKYSYLKGEDSKNNTPLVFMAPNRFFGSLTYRVDKFILISDKIKLRDLEFDGNMRWVFQQKNHLPEQDFLAPPEAYQLIGARISTNIISPDYKIRLYVKIDNVLNIKFRDYMNRQRYFANDLGRSITLGLSFKF